MAYPSLRRLLTEDELRDHFTLTLEERDWLSLFRRDRSRLGFAVFFLAYRFLGYPPRHRVEVSTQVVEWIASHLGVESSLFSRYRWAGPAWKTHLDRIRSQMGLRPFEREDGPELVAWLASRGHELFTRREWMAAALRRCTETALELPREKELWRLILSARRRFYDGLYQMVAARLGPETQTKLEECLKTSDPEMDTSPFDWLKSAPGKPGRKTLLEETQKLETLRRLTLPNDLLVGVPEKVQRILKRRARAETAAQMRRHPPARRDTLLGVLLSARLREVTDQVVQLFLTLVHKAHKKGLEALKEEVASDIPRALRKGQLLGKVVRAAEQRPEAAIGPYLLEVLGEETYRRLLEEMEGPSYDVARARHVQRKLGGYRKALGAALDTLDFQATNPRQLPLLEGLALVRRHLNARRSHYPEQEPVPFELLTGTWSEVVLEDGPKGPRTYKPAFELCVFSQLEKAIKCKEIWVQDAYRFRNPDEDLPADWSQCRADYYAKRGLPQEAAEFTRPLQAEMRAGLEKLNEFFGRDGQDVEIRHPGGGGRGIFCVPRPEKRPVRTILGEIKERVIQRWGILNLLDILVEADRRVNFVGCFPTSAQRQVLGHEEVRKRLLLVLFSLGTNVGLKRIHAAANPDCSYDDLRYFARRFVTIEAMREANARLVKLIMAVRNPTIWGAGTACASDGKHLGAWERNPVTEWHPHYATRGVMVYWHVETNATCIYSQLRTVSASQVAAMIEGLVRHDTEMRVESNSVDSHGQSEVGFAFCRMLGFDLLPRLKRIKDERLFLPDKGLAAQLPRLSSVLASRPVIDWQLMEEQYDEMVRHVVAVAEGTGPTDSILRRFNHNNRTNPVYRAFIELGKALKTMFLCRYFTQPPLRLEIHEALNVIENWNSCVEFICFARKMELHTNDPVMLELTVLSIHLLQNALVLANTMMVERVLGEGLLERMVPEDFRAMTPLFTSNTNPYGDFHLNLSKPSFLAVS